MLALKDKLLEAGVVSKDDITRLEGRERSKYFRDLLAVWGTEDLKEVRDFLDGMPTDYLKWASGISRTDPGRVLSVVRKDKTTLENKDARS